MSHSTVFFLLYSCIFFLFILFNSVTFILYTRAACPSLSIPAFCETVVDYTFDNTTCYNNIRANSLKSLNVVLTSIGSAECRGAVAAVACSYAYKRAGVPLPQPANSFMFQKPCATLCAAASDTPVVGKCFGLDKVAAMVVLNDIGNTASLLSSGDKNPCDSDLNSTTCNAGPTPAKLVDLRYAHCEKYTGVICKGIVDTPSYGNIYVLPGSTQARVESLISSIYFMLAMAPVAGGCRDSLAQWICVRAFPSCDSSNTLKIPISVNTSIPLPVSLPRLPCQSLTSSYLSKCAPLLKVLYLGSIDTSQTAEVRAQSACLYATLAANLTGQVFFPPVYSCTGSLLSQGLLDFPVVNSQFSINPPLSTYCQSANFSFNVNFQCNTPLVTPEDPRSPTVPFNILLPGGSCGIPCPVPLYSKSEYEMSDNILFIFSLMSFMCATFLFFTWTVFSEKRKNWHVWALTGCFFAVNMSLFFSFSVPTDHGRSGFVNMSCKNNVEGIDFSYGGYCVFQAFCIIYFGLAGVIWWLLQGLDLYLKIVLRWSLNADQEFRKHIAFSSTGWGLPLIMSLIPICTGKLGNQNNGIPWCFITSSRMAWGTFYFPIGAAVVINAFFLFSISVQVYRSSAAMGTDTKEGSWFVYVRPIAFVICFVIVWTFILAYRFYEWGHEDLYTSQVTSWIKCAMITRPVALSQGIDHVCQERPSPNVPLWYLVQFFVSAQGIFLFIAYFYIDNFILWWNLLIKGLVYLNLVDSSYLPSTRSMSSHNDNTGVNRAKSLTRMNSHGNDNMNRSHTHVPDKLNFARENTVGNTEIEVELPTLENETEIVIEKNRVVPTISSLPFPKKNSEVASQKSDASDKTMLSRHEN